jgi:hypothetical protein
MTLLAKWVKILVILHGALMGVGSLWPKLRIFAHTYLFTLLGSAILEACATTPDNEVILSLGPIMILQFPFHAQLN